MTETIRRRSRFAYVLGKETDPGDGVWSIKSKPYSWSVPVQELTYPNPRSYVKLRLLTSGEEVRLEAKHVQSCSKWQSIMLRCHPSTCLRSVTERWNNGGEQLAANAAGKTLDGLKAGCKAVTDWWETSGKQTAINAAVRAEGGLKQAANAWENGGKQATAKAAGIVAESLNSALRAIGDAMEKRTRTQPSADRVEPEVLKSFEHFVVTLLGFALSEIKDKGISWAAELLLPDEGSGGLDVPSGHAEADEWERFKTKKATEIALGKILDKAMEVPCMTSGLSSMKAKAKQHYKKKKTAVLRVLMKKLSPVDRKYDYDPSRALDEDSTSMDDLDDFFKLGSDVAQLKQTLSGIEEMYEEGVKETKVPTMAPPTADALVASIKEDQGSEFKENVSNLKEFGLVTAAILGHRLGELGLIAEQGALDASKLIEGCEALSDMEA